MNKSNEKINNKRHIFDMSFTGFTLIELLAVIIILAIVALITIPAVMNIINVSKKKTLENSAQNLIRASELYLTNLEFKEGSFTGGYITDLANSDIEFNGKKFENEELIINSDHEIALAIYEDGYCTYKKFDDKEITIVKTAKENCLIDKIDTIYSVGTMVYFNPKTGKMCTDYKEDETTMKATTDCLKWYIIGNSGKNVDMLLSHNIIEKVVWNSSGITVDGPSTVPGEVLDVLKTTTENWSGVPTRTDKYIDPAYEYTIDYTGYKARLIEANEIWEITKSTNGRANWNSGSADLGGFYFDGSQLSGKGTSKYPWLYNYTRWCYNSGCETTSGSETATGYWTSSSTKYGGTNSKVWHPYGGGRIRTEVTTSENIGIRPVITISKSSFG